MLSHLWCCFTSSRAACFPGIQNLLSLVLLCVLNAQDRQAPKSGVGPSWVTSLETYQEFNRGWGTSANQRGCFAGAELIWLWKAKPRGTILPLGTCQEDRSIATYLRQAEVLEEPVSTIPNVPCFQGLFVFQLCVLLTLTRPSKSCSVGP